MRQRAVIPRRGIVGLGLVRLGVTATIATACAFATARAAEGRMWRRSAADDLVSRITKDFERYPDWPDWIRDIERQAAEADERERPFLDLLLVIVYCEASKLGDSAGQCGTSPAAKAEPPAWSKERLAESVEWLFERVQSSFDILKQENYVGCRRLFRGGVCLSKACPTVYDLAVRYMVGFYGTMIPDESRAKGLALLDDLIEFHRVQGNVDLLADSVLRRIDYELADPGIPDDERASRVATAYDRFADEWFDKSPVAATAIFRRAVALRDGGKPFAALRLARKGAFRWPQTPEGDACHELGRSIKFPEIQFETERILSSPFPSIDVWAKNVSRLHFKLVKADWRDLLTKSPHGDTSRDRKFALSREKGEREWEVPVSRCHDCKLHRFSIRMPSDLPRGAYLLVAGKDEDSVCHGVGAFAEFVEITDLALAVDSTFEGGDIRGTLFLSESGHRVKGATVEAWRRSDATDGDELVRCATTRTDENGDFEIRGVNSLDGCLRVNGDVGETVVPFDRYGSYGVSYGEDMKAHRLSLLTDRVLYRPGQPILVKGFAGAFDSEKRAYEAKPGIKVNLELLGLDFRRFGRATATANDWGAFSAVLDVPPDARHETYMIRADDESRRFSEYVFVDVGLVRLPKDGKASESAGMLAELGVAGWQESDRPIRIGLSLRTSDGASVSASGRLRVHALRGPARPVRKPVAYMPVRRLYLNVTDRKDSPWNWKSWRNGQELVALDLSAKDGVGECEVTLPPGAYRLAYETGDADRPTVLAAKEIAVFDSRSARLPFAAPSFLAASASGPVKVGSRLAYRWASGYETGVGRLELFSNGRRILVRDCESAQPAITVEHEVTDDDVGNIECRSTFVRDGQHYTERIVTPVTRDGPLEIVPERFEPNPEPGSEQRWTFKVSSPCEVAAFMCDRALDRLSPRSVVPPFGAISSCVHSPECQIANSRKTLERLDFGGIFPVGEAPTVPDFGSLVDRRQLLHPLYWFERRKIRYESVRRLSEPRHGEGGGFDAVSVRPGSAAWKDIREPAFFLPHLETDAEGRVTVPFAVPDSPASWRLYLVAHDRKFRCGVFCADVTVTPSARSD